MVIFNTNKYELFFQWWGCSHLLYFTAFPSLSLSLHDRTIGPQLHQAEWCLSSPRIPVIEDSCPGPCNKRGLSHGSELVYGAEYGGCFTRHLTPCGECPLQPSTISALTWQSPACQVKLVIGYLLKFRQKISILYTIQIWLPDWMIR